MIPKVIYWLSHVTVLFLYSMKTSENHNSFSLSIWLTTVLHILKIREYQQTSLLSTKHARDYWKQTYKQFFINNRKKKEPG